MVASEINAINLNKKNNESRLNKIIFYRLKNIVGQFSLSLIFPYLLIIFFDFYVLTYLNY